MRQQKRGQMLPTAAKVRRSGGLPRDFLDEGNAQKDEQSPPL
jgi:hypothetical protein